MSKVKLELREKSDDELKTFAEAHEGAMDGNTNFPTPTPNAADFATRIQAYGDSLTAATQAETKAKEATAKKDAERVLLETALTERGNYVDTTSKGDEVKILSSGFSVRSPRTPPPPSLPAPTNLAATMGDHSGEVDLEWDSVKGAKTYVVERALHAMPRVWEQVAIVPRSRYTAEGLTSGQTYAFRVRAIGSGGDSDWSDEAIKMSP